MLNKNHMSARECAILWFFGSYVVQYSRMNESPVKLDSGF